LLPAFTTGKNLKNNDTKYGKDEETNNSTCYMGYLRDDNITILGILQENIMIWKKF